MKAEIELPKFTPQQIAEMFWHMDGEKNLTPNGARVMEMIGAFVEGKRLQPLA